MIQKVYQPNPGLKIAQIPDQGPQNWFVGKEKRKSFENIFFFAKIFVWKRSLRAAGRKFANDAMGDI